MVLSPRMRKDFSKLERIIDIPNLMEIQKESYARFLQRDISPDEREDVGLQAAFKSTFPIRDFTGTSSLEFVNYTIGEPKYEVEECLQRGMTYEAPLRITVRLVVYDIDKDTGAKSVRDVKEQEIYFGNIPLMTERGTFVINGTERVVVSQLHRSPGIFFDHDEGKNTSGKLLYSARIIPLRGSWIDLEFDAKDILYARIDRRRKFPVTLLLRALGLSTEELLNYFYKTEWIIVKDHRIYRKLDPDILRDIRATEDMLDPKTRKVLIRKNQKITETLMKRLKHARVSYFPLDIRSIDGRVFAHDVVDPNTGETFIRCNEELTQDKFDETVKRNIGQVPLIFADGQNVSTSLRDTLLIDKATSPDEAILEIYRRLRPTSPPTPEIAADFLNNLFFNPDYYNLSKVGRLKLNLRLGMEAPLTQQTLTKEDLLMAVKRLIELKDRQGPVDDIDHLGNRRVRAVGELLENQYRIGLVRMERAVKERMVLQEIETLMPHDLVNPKPVSAVVKEFFGTSQLSQFMDQTNPLSEVTHKRRLSALGPGGLTRERAGFEVRDVHPTHYGRICSIETPEGPNIGLIVSLSTYARVNEFGFIETPYREVKNGKVTKDVRFLSALDEGSYPIAQANAPINKKGKFIKDLVSARVAGEFVMVRSEEVRLMDVSPNQLVSVAASLIPFLEHDDANRALMGSNMQRQAIPLLRTENPLIGTGIEEVVARDSGVTVVAREDGYVENVDASRIVIRYGGKKKGKLGTGCEIYKLIKYQRTNQSTCFNQKSIVKKGDFIKRGQIIVDGPATDGGELALGRNVMVAFMPWGGYNFEDSILISERLVKEDIYTSVHIEEFEATSRDTKLGKEEITRDIPNVAEEALKDLDESGIIRIGAEVKPDDVLVGKVTPKGETMLSPEEKLLRAIFGEKAADVKDTSLRVPPGIEGIVIDAKVFSRGGVDKDNRSKSIEGEEVAKLIKDQNDEIKVLKKGLREELEKLLVGKVCATSLKDEKSGRKLLKKGEAVTAEVISKTPYDELKKISLIGKEKVEQDIERILDYYDEQIDLVKTVFEGKIHRLKKGDELAPGVIKMVKVYVVMKRKLCVGDKMAGRHGNKGVVSRVLPEEDMPYFADGTPVDIVLNPLGVPSRMNVGQILEIHLGWASKELGRQIGELVDKYYTSDGLRKRLAGIYSSKEYSTYFADIPDQELDKIAHAFKDGIPIASPVFDGAQEAEIRRFLKESKLPETGQTTLYDGRTGEPFDSKVTVGIMYIMKLHHLVDDKIHARSIGPYSLVTQQPLGGKAQFGGQRLGEMEVWAMEAYGASSTLQEFLTVKSDDKVGRARMYEKIVKGEHSLEPGLPESFKVLIKEIQSLGLNVELLEDEQNKG